MTARLLAKLQAKGAALDSIGGGARITPQDVAGMLAGCEPNWYIAIMAKWAEDEGSQRQLLRLLQGIFMARYLREGKEHGNGVHILARLSAELVYLQYLDGYRCNHCEGRGVVYGQGGAKDCTHCGGNSRGCFSEGFKTRYLNTDNIRPYQGILDDVEADLNSWESSGLSYLARKNA